jgi:polyisoprenoid-binding protein YceI
VETAIAKTIIAFFHRSTMNRHTTSPMKKLSFAALCAATIFACALEPSASNDPASGSGIIKEEEQAATKIHLDTSSSVEWQRYKHVKHSSNTIKLGKSTVNFSVDDARYTAVGTLGLEEGWWQVKQGKFDGGVIKLDMNTIAALQINDKNEVELRSPDYLDVAKYPFATIRVKSITSRNDSSIVKAEITIKDTTAKVEFPAKVDWGAGNTPKTFAGRFVIDGKAWKLFRPRAGQEISEDRLEFLCRFNTK